MYPSRLRSVLSQLPNAPVSSRPSRYVPALRGVVRWGQTQKQGQVQAYSRKTGGRGEGLRSGEADTWHVPGSPASLHTLKVLCPPAGDRHDQRPAGADGQDGECVQPCHPPHCLCCATGLLPGHPQGATQAGHQEEEECHPEVSPAAHTSLHNHPQWKDQLRFEQL